MYQNKKDFTAQIKVAMAEAGIAASEKTPILNCLIDAIVGVHSHAPAYMINYQNDPQEDFGICQATKIEKLQELWDKTILNNKKEFRTFILPDLRGRFPNDHDRKCSHDMEKKFLLTSHYHKCKKCGFEE